jgi:hypothetical protein
MEFTHLKKVDIHELDDPDNYIICIDEKNIGYTCNLKF